MSGPKSWQVSVRKSVGEALEARSIETGIAVSSLVEQALAPALGIEPAKARRRSKRRRIT